MRQLHEKNSDQHPLDLCEVYQPNSDAQQFQGTGIIAFGIFKEEFPFAED